MTEPWAGQPSTAPFQTDLDPVSVLAGIDRNTAELDAAGRELGRVIDALGKAELAYGDAFEDAMVQLVEDYEGKRLPGEDVRRALIHKDKPDVRALYHAVRKLERRKDAVESWGRKVEKALSGRQSIMNGLKAEQSAPASQFSGETYGRRAA